LAVVTRFLRLVLLTFALIGLAGESTAMAMAPLVAPSTTMQAAMPGMDCKDMPTPDGTPCKKLTWQCIAAMGCLSVAAVEPVVVAPGDRLLTRWSHDPSDAKRLAGRSLGPEPDPPSFLI
jgi:hypothetical protein